MRHLSLGPDLRSPAGLLAAAVLLGPAAGVSQPRTPWGDPDLQGTWTSATLTPMERPQTLAGRDTMTEAEAAELERTTVELARYGNGPYLDHTDLDTGERCITDGLPLMVPIQPYNMNFLILQTADTIVMLHEMYHEIRIIPLDGRPKLPEQIGLWLGDARGLFEFACHEGNWAVTNVLSGARAEEARAAAED